MVSIRMAHDATTSTTALTVADRLTGLAAFTLAIALLRLLPFRLTLATARAIKHLGRHPTGPGDGARLIAARDWAARWFPGRAACLENSLAAFLAATLRGRSVDWCVGCRFNPAQSHAWIEAGCGPIGEPDLSDRPFHVTVRT